MCHKMTPLSLSKRMSRVQQQSSLPSCGTSNHNSRSPHEQADCAEATLQASSHVEVAYATRTFRRVSLSKLAKRLSAFGLSATAGREITDALVIFSMSVISYVAISDWGGLSILDRVLGAR